MSEVKQSLSGGNASKFEDCVEVHMQHIMSGLSRYLIETFIVEGLVLKNTECFKRTFNVMQLGSLFVAIIFKP
jgi:hypothetical protein